MLKARAGNHILFGLSEMNLQRLRIGQPIQIDMTELGLTGTVFIFYGETEEKMRREMADLIGPNTEFLDRLPKDS